jgi:hypothetical protein
MIDPADLAARTSVVPGRSCGSCAMCCKLYDVPEVGSMAGKWCRHCTPGKGCGIHTTRPETCRRFFCGWMVSASLGPEWKPERAKLIIRLIPGEGSSLCVAVDVDEGFPAAWQRPDIYAKLKRIAAYSREVVVSIGRRRIVVLPDRDVDVGVVGDDEEVEVRGSGPLAEVRKVKRRAAEAAGMLTSSHALD